MEERLHQPMRVSDLTHIPERRQDWVAEPKADGHRMMTYRFMARVILLSRHGGNYATYAPKVVDQMPDALGTTEAVLDGELVAYDIDGRQNHHRVRSRDSILFYYPFDILQVQRKHGKDRDLTQQPWSERRKILEDVVIPQPNIQLMPYSEDLDEMVQRAHELGFEGVVLKRKNSRYVPGARSHDWQRLKFPDYE
jgi:bifunctional non-homologous end joining protein LigD